ncbi:MAG: hypothetical protein AAGA31_11140, partial [Bacteroidota bacterium]
MMKHLFLISFLCILTLSSCVQNLPQDKTDYGALAKEVLAFPSVPEVIQTIEAQEGGKMLLPSGTILEVPAGSFIDAVGRPVTGEVELHVKEVKDNASMVKTDLSTVTVEGELLQTKGMYQLTANKDGAELSIASGKFVNLYLPGAAEDYDGYELFYGAENAGGTLEWEPALVDPDSISAAYWEKEYKLSTSVWAVYRDNEDDFSDLSMLDLGSYFSLTPTELEAIVDREIVIHWTLFNDGELSILKVDGKLSSAIREKLLTQAQAIP